MNLINEGTVEELAVWAERTEDKGIYARISQEVETYYLNKGSMENDLMEYSFENIGELKNSLQKYGGLPGNQQILKTLTLEIVHGREKCKSKDKIIPYSADVVNGDGRIHTRESDLSEYIYAF